MTRIVTQLGEDSVLEALRELAPEENGARIFSLNFFFEGQIDPKHLVIGYSSNAFLPPVRLVTFSGQVRKTDAGTTIHGNVSYGWIIYAMAAWFIAIPPLIVVGSIADGNFLSNPWGLVVCVAVFFLGRAFVRTKRSYVVAEISRAVRGKVTQN